MPKINELTRVCRCWYNYTNDNPERLFCIVCLLSLCCLFISSNSQYECHEFESCASTSVISSTTEDIECWGYRSCIHVGTIESTIDGEIDCLGSYSCYKTDSLISYNTSSTSIYDGIISCFGLFSCANINQLINQYGQTACSGSLSCYNSNIYVSGGDQTEFYCTAFKSCANSYIEGDSQFLFYGTLSAQNAVIKAVNAPTYTFYGGEAGKGATFICLAGWVCSINCYVNACNQLTLECDDGGVTSCVFSITCIGAEKSDICEQGYDMNKLVEIMGYNVPSLANATVFSNFNNSNTDICSSSASINCDEYNQCSGQSLDTTVGEPGSVCCTSFQGCYDAEHIATNIDSNSTTAIRCDGYVFFFFLLYKICFWLSCFLF